MKKMLKNISILTIVILGCGNILTAQTVDTDTTYINHETYKQRVLNYSKDIMKSAEQKKAMEEAVKYAKTNFLPRIDFAGSAQYRINDYNLSLGSAPFSMPGESYSLGATLSQIIYNGGAVQNSYKAARIQDSIAGKAEELTLQNITYAAEINYWSTVAQKELYKAMCQYVDIVSSLADILNIRYEDGLIAKTDYLQTIARLKDAQMSKSDAYKSYQLALQNLNVMMGINPLSATNPMDSIALKLPNLQYLGMDEALLQRPDYKISKMQIDYQQKQLRIIQSQFNPQLSIGLQQTWGTQMLNFDGSTMFNSTAFASLKIPLFAWGARYKRVNSQKAMINSAELDRQMMLDNISKELSSAWTEYQENTKQIKLAWDATIISQENLDINTFSYNEGKLTILDVLSAQLTWIQSHTKYISTLLMQKVSRSAYLKAIGDIK
ncbi:MAG: TolC family protein [Bacteroidales bacterium]